MLSNAKIVAFVATADPGRSRAFYEGALGLTLVADEPFALVFNAGGTTLRISKVQSVLPAAHTVLGWGVDDVHRCVEGLSKRGVVFERYTGMPQDEHGVWKSTSGAGVAWFKDPDGNLLSVTQAQ